MKKYFLVFCLSFTYLLSFSTFSDDSKNIKLHKTDNKDQDIKSEKPVIDDQDIIIAEEIVIVNDEENNNLGEESTETEVVNEEIEQTAIENISTKPGYWEQSSKNNLIFLVEQIDTINSLVLKNYLTDIIEQETSPPKEFELSKFDLYRINFLIKLGFQEKAMNALNSINTFDENQHYYNLFKVNYFLIRNNLSKACSFKDTLSNKEISKESLILKLRIFCSFLEENFDEADLLNTILLDTNDEDQYFQIILENLKNNNTTIENISDYKIDKNSLSLYSAMLRLGDFAFTEDYLKIDSPSLMLAIALNPQTEISIRIKAAQKAYYYNIFTAESMAAIYQSVDFTNQELTNPISAIESYKDETEKVMALLFQSSRIQLLPISRLESLKLFWSFAKQNSLEKLAFEVSKDLIVKIEPSSELNEYILDLIKAHIYNKNFVLAEELILTAKNISQNNDLISRDNISQLEFLLTLKNLKNLDANQKIKESLILDLEKILNQENLSYDQKSIINAVLDHLSQKRNILEINNENVLVEKRLMPSLFVINNIEYSSETENIGELILSIVVSLNNENWTSAHPQLVKIILESLDRPILEDLKNNILIEILEQNKLI